MQFKGELVALRYNLTRTLSQGTLFGPAIGRLLFVMLNPSTADEKRNDPTVVRVIGFAEREGAGELEVVNLYPFRATYPERMKPLVTIPWWVDSPVNEENMRVVRVAAMQADRIIVAWGRPPFAEARGQAGRVLDLLRQCGDVYRIGPTCADGSPRHPLYMPKNAPIVRHCDGTGH